MFDTIKLKMKVLKDRFFRKKEPEKFYIKKRPPVRKLPSLHIPPVIDIAFYGKAVYRLFKRSKTKLYKPATPTSTTFRSNDGRSGYRVFSDGSYRRMKAGKRQVVPI